MRLVATVRLDHSAKKEHLMTGPLQLLQTLEFVQQAATVERAPQIQQNVGQASTYQVKVPK